MCVRTRISEGRLVSTRAACSAASIASVSLPSATVTRVPSVRGESLRSIFGERDIGARRKRHAIVVVQAGELAEPQVAGERRGFGAHAFHQVAVADDRVRRVVDDGEARTVVSGGELRLGDRHADGVRQPLAERARRHLDARRVSALRMPGCLAIPLAELLDVVERQIVAGQMQQAVEQHRAVTGRQHEAIAIEPVWIARVVLQLRVHSA